MTQIPNAVTSIFNSVLGRCLQEAIAMDRIHCALRPKGKDTDPPRDIVCCLTDYRVKKDILRMARDKRLTHENAPIQIFQDLSGITLKHRRDLRPLLDVLRAKDIKYKWKFPFCLSVSHQGRSALLKVPGGPVALLRDAGDPPGCSPGLVRSLSPVSMQMAECQRRTHGDPSLQTP